MSANQPLKWKEAQISVSKQLCDREKKNHSQKLVLFPLGEECSWDLALLVGSVALLSSAGHQEKPD